MAEPIVLPGKYGKNITITASTRCPACGEGVLDDPQHLTVDYVGNGRKAKTFVRHSACPPPLPDAPAEPAS